MEATANTLGLGDMSREEQRNFAVFMALIMGAVLGLSRYCFGDAFPFMNQAHPLVVALVSAMFWGGLAWWMGKPNCRQAGARFGLFVIVFMMPFVGLAYMLASHYHWLGL